MYPATGMMAGMPRKKNTSLNAPLHLTSSGQPALALEQIRLLEAIDQQGSITKAARQLGISYKTAWDRVAALNNLSATPLVNRSAGGARGGGTSLTDQARRIITGFHAIEEEHAAFLVRLGRKIHGFGDIATFMKTGNLKTSARNQFRGTVTSVNKGAVNSEVRIGISQSRSLRATITNDSVTELQLKKGVSVIALIKASSVIVSRDPQIATSAENRFQGTLLSVRKGAVNTQVILDLGDHKSIAAIVTNDSAEQLQLARGKPACALFSASSVILMTE